MVSLRSRASDVDTRIAVPATVVLLLSAALLVAWADHMRGEGSVRSSVGPCALDAIAWSGATRESLPAGLREASGLAVVDDTLLLAHDDERAVVALINARTGERTGRFELGPDLPRDDFEGIAVLADRLYLATSGARLYETRVGADGESVPFNVIETGLGDECEFEGLAADESNGTLLLPCKNGSTGALRDRVTVFEWSVDGAAHGVRVSVPIEQVRAERESSFRPSAIEMLATGDLLILSGADRSIAVVTAPAAWRCTRRLGSGHPQAEGLAILPDGSFVIADEGDPARLTFYRPER